MQGPFEELESLVVNVNDVQRSSYLSEQVLAVLLTSNPARYLQDSVDIIGPFNLQKKLMDYIAQSKNN